MDDIKCILKKAEVTKIESKVKIMLSSCNNYYILSF